MCAEIEELPAAIQEQLFSELLDREAQQTLEAEPPLINWSHELTVTLGTSSPRPRQRLVQLGAALRDGNSGCRVCAGSRLYALWNRSAGDCLPDAVCQAAYGVFDRGNALRQALADSLHHAHRRYTPQRRPLAPYAGVIYLLNFDVVSCAVSTSGGRRGSGGRPRCCSTRPRRANCGPSGLASPPPPRAPARRCTR